MNKKLVESYIKDSLRKQFGKEVTFENCIAYISTYVEVYFEENAIYIFGYKTQAALILNYPGKDDYDISIRILFCLIMAQYNVEVLFSGYNEEDS